VLSEPHAPASRPDRPKTPHTTKELFFIVATSSPEIWVLRGAWEPLVLGLSTVVSQIVKDEQRAILKENRVRKIHRTEQNVIPE
jgi:hypothetical protein